MADLAPETDPVAADGVLPAVKRVHVTHSFTNWATNNFYKLRKIVRAVRSSPQRRQYWAREIQFVQLGGSQASGGCSASLMLILDVRTRWASTHQMLRKLL